MSGVTTRRPLGAAGVTIADALTDVSVDLPAGTVTAVVGGDGAGKTTLLRVLAGGRRADAGRVRRPPAARIGYVPTGSGWFAELTVAENLAFAAAAYRVHARGSAATADLLDRIGLAGFEARLAGRLSGGQRQKLAVAMAMLHGPALLVLDEPTTGIDPVSRTEVWRLLAEAAAAGAAVVLSTSYLDEAERAAAVLVLHEGRTLLAGAPDDLVAATPGRVVEVAAPRDHTRAWRLGARWREWLPAGVAAPDGAEPIEPRLEDAVVVAMLAAGVTGGGADRGGPEEAR